MIINQAGNVYNGIAGKDGSASAGQPAGMSRGLYATAKAARLYSSPYGRLRRTGNCMHLAAVKQWAHPCLHAPLGRASVLPSATGGT
jgi:hypothetical protein